MWKTSETLGRKEDKVRHISLKITIVLVVHCTKHFRELDLSCTSFTITCEISIFITLKTWKPGSERLWVIYSYITIK